MTETLDHLLCASDTWAWPSMVYAALSPTVGHRFHLLTDKPENVALLPALVRRRPYSYLFFLHWSHRVPAEICDRYRCVNFHCTPLPYGRGGAPIENMILRGHTRTVLTAYRMTPLFDAGPVYLRAGPISLAGTKSQILQRFIEPCAAMVRTIVAEQPVPRPQVGEVVRFWRLDKADHDALWARREAEAIGGMNA